MKVDQTIVVLNDHIWYDNGNAKTVCVSSCLMYFGIRPNKYHYTGTTKNRFAYKQILRRLGYNVRSRKSEFKIGKFSKDMPTMTELKSRLRKSNYTDNDKFLVCGFQKGSAHLMVLDGKGDIIVDTAPQKKWRIEDICLVY